jgi:hypothetical protein
VAELSLLDVKMKIAKVVMGVVIVAMLSGIVYLVVWIVTGQE